MEAFSVFFISFTSLQSFGQLLVVSLLSHMLLPQVEIVKFVAINFSFSTIVKFVVIHFPSR